MQLISEAKLQSDFAYRIQYLRDFIEFTSEDAAALHAARPVVAPLVPLVVDTVYEKLLSFSVTAKAFVPRQTGYSGETPTSLNDLSQSHPQIKFRKDFLARYLVKLVTMDYDKMSTWEYLDKVGLMHTGEAGFSYRQNKPSLRVEYIQCAILLGYVEDILVNAVLTHPDLDDATKLVVMRAFNKLIWIQNDLFARHYISEEKASPSNVTVAKPWAVTLAAAFVAVGCFAQYLISRR
ncbi:hypothetical protein CC1G_05615 [Coprinopsis cinerea okayama7|uniref:Globin-sensor domain-containing protein n=1 Tax=Coprinopsis cinerea (strain Okayama-7 / 130 / ATCC MYA-4618 / FGSC 9003) TaxID=240176 RepID=A8P1M8_COPC7|nr:hypothetical protein CC1G_05615 [Coprinopsis cinerea okayama7\|eukprot:XP_001838134.1 hypothetical protein CC1G_05615 [Coprinopsis cinerea okayama7\